MYIPSTILPASWSMIESVSLGDSSRIGLITLATGFLFPLALLLKVQSVTDGDVTEVVAPHSVYSAYLMPSLHYSMGH